MKHKSRLPLDGVRVIELGQHAGRVKRTDEIDLAINKWTEVRPLNDVLAAMEAANVPAGRVYTAADIARDPQYEARDMLLRQCTFDGLNLAVPGIVPKLSATPGSIRKIAPRLGEHTDAVLKTIGLNPEELQDLRSRRLIQ